MVSGRGGMPLFNTIVTASELSIKDVTVLLLMRRVAG
jgi:hypothetical protein